MNELQRVMCVDDDPDIRMILEFSLGTVGGYQVKACAGGRAALAAVAEFKPQLVLLDVMMPELSGPETLAALRELPLMKGVPIVFLTAKAMPDELEQLLGHGATGLIVKPFDPMRLPADILPFWEHGRG
ncbi:response regulator [Roseateles oligotrophus]|uniref:Response regulator n=1 Tax=Roseateles oligotrophus TaxID=1769250 RepID=A0ABT2YFQ8_9BURK|nr:response regulator [Roseateles oligotrophus]MCV2368891.1 response regulator [Roseateles oligotrophus]